MSILRIFFSGGWQDGKSICPWALCDEQGAVLLTGAATLHEMPKGHECVAIVAADRVLNIEVALPPGSRKRLHAALPYVAEEYTLADPEELHVVPGQVLPDGRRALAIVDKAWLARIVKDAHRAKLSLRRMVAESAMPLLADDTWVLAWDGSSGFVKTGGTGGVALDCGDAQRMPLGLRLSLEAAQVLPRKIELRFVQGEGGQQRTMPQWDDLLIPVVAGAEWDWRKAAIADEALNLLCGEFTPRARIQAWWPKLRPAAYLLLAALLVEIAGSHIQWAKLAYAKNQLSAEMLRTFRATFGDAVVVVNPVLQMQRNLAEMRHVAGLPDAGDFLPLMDAASRSLADLPEGSVTGMHYEAGRLDLDIRLPRKADFSALRKSLQGSGLDLRMGDIRDLGGRVESRVTLAPEAMP